MSLPWGFSFVAMRHALDSFPPLMTTAMRAATASLPMIVFLRPPRVPWVWLIALALSLGYGQHALLFIGLDFGMPAGLASLVLQTQVFFTTLLAFLILRERPGWPQLAGMAVATLGMVMIGLTMPGGATLVGLAMVIAGAISWGFTNVLVKLAATDELLRLMAWAHFLPLPLLLATSYGLEGGAAYGALVSAPWSAYGAVIYLGLISTCFGFMLWSRLLRIYSASVVAPFSLVIPVSGMSLAALLLAEPFGPLRIAGAAVVLAGLALAVVRTSRPVT
jgi:O-acetylserine/cysteine efflux transporter